MRFLDEAEHVVRAALAGAEDRRRGARSDEDRRRADDAIVEAIDRLDPIQAAIRAAQPYRTRLVKCSVCGNPFSDELSYLKHWQMGRLAGRGMYCERTLSILKVEGFVADEYRYPGEQYPEYVLRHPSHEPQPV